MNARLMNFITWVNAYAGSVGILHFILSFPNLSSNMGIFQFVLRHGQLKMTDPSGKSPNNFSSDPFEKR